MREFADGDKIVIHAAPRSIRAKCEKHDRTEHELYPGMRGTIIKQCDNTKQHTYTVPPEICYQVQYDEDDPFTSEQTAKLREANWRRWRVDHFAEAQLSRHAIREDPQNALLVQNTPV